MLYMVYIQNVAREGLAVKDYDGSVEVVQVLDCTNTGYNGERSRGWGFVMRMRPFIFGFFFSLHQSCARDYTGFFFFFCLWSDKVHTCWYFSSENKCVINIVHSNTRAFAVADFALRILLEEKYVVLGTVGDVSKIKYFFSVARFINIFTYVFLKCCTRHWSRSTLFYLEHYFQFTNYSSP